MLHRRHWLLAVLGMLGWLTRRAVADEMPIGTGTAPGLDYQKQLEMGLKCRRPVEFEFVERVVVLVRTGVLPRSLVDTTFDWARKKRDKNVQYFEFALRTRAKKMGVTI